MNDQDLEQLGINVIRGLAMDAPQAANSGHPGTAMALAPLAHVLWTRIMKYDAGQPGWPDRDRFILSAGHASILLYSMLFLTGYGLTLDDLKNFRQWESRTPGHPEVHHTPGVEVTTGPLGQGFGNGVGMGFAERWMRAQFGADICNHHTFVICSDGDLMEGVSHEAASLAGHLGLGRLIYIYDDNHITIDGPTELALDDDPAKRFDAYGWHVNNIGEVANDVGALEGALRDAMEVEDRPSIIILRSHIGWPSPKHTDTKEAHGSPLGTEDVKATKEILGLPPQETFWVPDEVLNFYRECGRRGRAARSEWDRTLAEWQGDKNTLECCWNGIGVDGWETKLPIWEAGKQVATRVASGDCVNAIADVVPGLVAGSADLTGNTGTKLTSGTLQSAEHPEGRQIAFGVREHAMGAFMNGASLHGGVVPVGGTFFNFSDYMRGAVRLAAISEAKVVYSWTHDSIGLGEDGPTHQPVEQLASLRAMPGIRVIRPADANETAHAWRIAINSNGPSALVLTRQNVPVLENTAERAEDVAKGAYILREASAIAAGLPEIVLIGTGSEVQLCMEAALIIEERGRSVRVVSMPSWDLFEQQVPEYRDSILPDVPTLAVEAAASFGWQRYADDSVSLDRFGASAPGAEALRRLGFTAENVSNRALALLAAEPEEDNDKASRSL